MKLFLSSMHPTNRVALLKLIGTSPSVVIIPNGWDTYPADRKATELEHVQSTFKQFGGSIALLDLTNADKKIVAAKLSGASLVWVMAGNTFYLNYLLRKSGFAEVIQELMEKGLVYGGESAGAAVAGPTLRGVEKVDNPAEAPETIWEGLGLVDYGVLPHWGWAKYREPIEAAKAEMEKYAHVVTITNQHALVIENGMREVVDNPSDEA